MQLIIVEGPDGAGKTTLVRGLIREFSFQAGERGTTDRKLLYTVTRSDTYRAMAHEVLGDEPPRIWDRLFFSEMVYAPIVGRLCEFSMSEQAYIRRVLEAMRVPIVLCLPPLAHVVENALKDEQMDGVVDNLTTIYEAYAQPDFMPEHTLVYDYTNTMTERGLNYVPREIIDEEINDYLQERRTRTW